ncbi:MAG: stage V sporulation protein T [Firmicutes bacterium]|nr:stage V sporulation protein T [Bacillota bacterium]
MKATGIVRRIDDLGRVVIPKEIRRTLRIREGDPLEIFVDRDGEVILKKYSPIGELGDFAQQYADSLNESTGHICLVTDRDLVIAVSGGAKKEFLNQPLGKLAETAMEERRTMMLNPGEGKGQGNAIDFLDGVNKLTAQVVSPIVAEGHPLGCVIICSKEADAVFGELESKLAETAASFLGKQMEG